MNRVRFNLMPLSIMLLMCLPLCGCSNNQTTPAGLSTDASHIAIGLDIDTAVERMSPYSDGGPLLTMVTRDSKLELKQWPVGGGVLVAVYSTQNNKITALDFHISDERPKALRMYWDFPVSSFDPKTGKMQLTVPVAESD